MKKLVLFDIDGTILNVEPHLTKSIFVDTFGELFNVDISQDVPSFHGKTDLQIIHDILKLHNIKNRFSIQQLWDLIYQKFEQKLSFDKIELLPGISNLIDLIYGDNQFAIGLVTGNFRRNAYLKLSIVKLETYFHFGGFGDDSPNRAHLPIIAINQAKNMKIISENYPQENTIIIGDTFRDIQAAKSNSMKAIAVATGTATAKELSLFKPDALFDDFSNYLNVFECIKEM